MSTDRDTRKKTETDDQEEKPESPESTTAEDTSDAVADNNDTGGDDDESSPARRWRRRALLGAVVVAFLALLGATGLLGWQLWQERQVDDAGEQARQAAVNYAQTLTSIDSAKVDENFDAVLDGATGEFKDMYSQSSNQLRQLLIDNKATAHGVVLESAVQSATKDTAVVLLFVDQSVSNTNVPDPRIDRSRIKMTMEYVDGRWRASKVELP
ncbi:Mce protein [Mycobacterium sp. E136]|uniref:Mce protein n=1 Tax=Mycobacterium sp. E136 TaxID=1834125 RepID=UPI0007FD640B|nr:Mce protein [Mycobacterium sp. E136]OBG86891.1 Mce protein [Mycobacterium sp. E136]